MKGSRGASLPGVGLGTGRLPVGPLGMGAGTVGVRGKNGASKKPKVLFSEETEARLDVTLGMCVPLQFVITALARSLPTHPFQPPPPGVVVLSAPRLWRGSPRSCPGPHREPASPWGIHWRALPLRASRHV